MQNFQFQGHRRRSQVDPLVLILSANDSCHRPPTSTLDAYAEPDYYAVLSIAASASPAEIKAAYHRALLLHHPDKNNALPRGDAVDVDLLRKAFATLSTPELRAQYDNRRVTARSGPRPAHVVSLEEFIEHESGNPEGVFWSYDCRCGGTYRITELDMDKDQHLIGCLSCSEVIWVGYEVVEDE